MKKIYLFIAAAILSGCTDAKWKIISAPDYRHTKPGDITPATLSSDCDIIYISSKDM